MAAGASVNTGLLMTVSLLGRTEDNLSLFGQDITGLDSPSVWIFLQMTPWDSTQIFSSCSTTAFHSAPVLHPIPALHLLLAVLGFFPTSPRATLQHNASPLIPLNASHAASTPVLVYNLS